MALPAQPEKAKLIAGVLTSSEDLFPRVRRALEDAFGPVDLESRLLGFGSTDYYEPQMGTELKRRFYSFEQLVEQDFLSRAKLIANELEARFAGSLPVRRPVNADPGLLLASKLVLASCKDFSHRIYLGAGVYAEVTLQFSRGAFAPLPWTYPDYRGREYHEFFLEARGRYLEQLRSQR